MNDDVVAFSVHVFVFYGPHSYDPHGRPFSVDSAARPTRGPSTIGRYTLTRNEEMPLVNRLVCVPFFNRFVPFTTNTHPHTHTHTHPPHTPIMLSQTHTHTPQTHTHTHTHTPTNPHTLTHPHTLTITHPRTLTQMQTCT